ncbi:MAG: hypothetical protein ACK5D9_02305 [Burkholderiales bacterium]
MKWLVMLAACDALVVLFFIAPELIAGVSTTGVAIGRFLTATAMPVVVLLLVNVIPSDVKAMLVYWKPLGVLPGSEAFTRYGPRDPRIDWTSLKKNVGTLPVLPNEQNSKWFKLYKQVINEVEVVEAHKLSLLYRDMAVLSLASLVCVQPVLFLSNAATSAQWIAICAFAVQYLLTAISARWSGIRLVCNVLAIHSTRKVSARTDSPLKQTS